ncbi:MAG: hypothetical protein Q9159_001745 [Coniocarpon cinnabarinum]
MSNILRRRIIGSDTPTSEPSSRTPSPALPADEGEDERVSVPLEKLNKLNEHLRKSSQQKGKKRRTAWIFGFGSLVGIIIALFLGPTSDVLDLAVLKQMNLDSLLDVLPAGLLQDAQDLQRHERDAIAYDSFAIGLHARSQGVEATHPVIMIPGVISTGLESWSTEQESQAWFRKRLWGSWSMMRALVMDKPAWKRHVMLDKETGLDPPGVKLRAAQGFDATDFFITGYWIWNKILENLATIGYDPTNAFTAAYDWRLSYGNLEVRDQYFTRLKIHIETGHRISGHKIVLLSHSMGSQVLFYFFHWVESELGGNGGPDWVETHIDSWINISGSMLGAVKDIPAVLSGEMKDTAQLNAFAMYGLEKFLARHERAEIFRAMAGISSMMPIGGNAIWGDENAAPDDPPGSNHTYGRYISFRNSSSPHAANLTADDVLPYLFAHTEPWYRQQIEGNYSHGIAYTTEDVEKNQHIPRKWINPLETRLPLAPSLKLYCFYGVGKPTERSYFYRTDNDPATKTEVTIDTHHTDSSINADHGVVMGEGDGTVNLLSLGYMCNKGWKIPRYNPAGVKITVQEMPHEPDRFSPRGGPNTGDHVDILGRSGLNDLVLKVAGGKGDLVEEEVVSRIREYAEKIKI